MRGAQRDSDEVEVCSRNRANGGTVGGIVPGAEHVERVDRDRDPAPFRALPGRLELLCARLEDQHGLHEQRQIAVAVAVEIILADRIGAGGGGHAADQERADVEPLPACEIVTDDDRRLGVEIRYRHALKDARCARQASAPREIED